MNVEKELKKTKFDPLYSTAVGIDCATGIASNVLEHWVEGGKPCPKCGSFHTQKDIAMCLTTYPCQYHFRCMNCSHTWTDNEWYNGGLSYQPQPESPNPLREYGWICPKCGRVYSPTTSQCPFCGGAYSPNVVYCGPNNGTKAVYDTMTISNTVNSSKIDVTQHDVKQDFDLQNIKAGKGLQQSNCHSNTYESFKQQHGE